LRQFSREKKCCIFWRMVKKKLFMKNYIPRNFISWNLYPKGICPHP
jgi:hypothetical protein